MKDKFYIKLKPTDQAFNLVPGGKETEQIYHEFEKLHFSLADGMTVDRLKFTKENGITWVLRTYEHSDKSFGGYTTSDPCDAVFFESEEAMHKFQMKYM